MKFKLSWVLIVVAVIATPFPLPVAATSLSYDTVKSLADRDEASLAADEPRLVEAQAKVLAPVWAGCAAQNGNADRSPFVVVFEIVKEGKILRTWRKGESQIAVCFEHRSAGLKLFVPPKTPFYSSFEMTFDR